MGEQIKKIKHIEIWKENVKSVQIFGPNIAEINYTNMAIPDCSQYGVDNKVIS